jgi:hypothetical protein
VAGCLIDRALPQTYGPVVSSRTGKLGFAVVSAASAALLLAAASASAGTLDQQQTVSNLDNGLFSNQSGAQTFTAGITGGLDQADLDLFKVGTPPATVTVEIRTASAGMPTAAVLGSRTIPSSTIGTSGAFVPVSFAPPVPVTAGTQYALVAYSEGAMMNAVGWLNQSSGDPYPGGGLFIDNADPLPPGTNWIGGEDGDDDYAFKTYVAPTPPQPPQSPANTVKKKCKKHMKKHKRSAQTAKKKKCKKKKKRSQSR